MAETIGIALIVIGSTGLVAILAAAARAWLGAGPPAGAAGGVARPAPSTRGASRATAAETAAPTLDDLLQELFALRGFVGDMASDIRSVRMRLEASGGPVEGGEPVSRPFDQAA